MEIRLIEQSITKGELAKIAQEGFGEMVKAVVDIEQEIMAIGGEMHAEEEVFLMEQRDSRRENTWGINIYSMRTDEQWIEFDSMINLKPNLGNRTRNIGSPEIREKIEQLVQKLVVD